MTTSVARAGALAAIGSLVVLAPLLGWVTPVMFAGVAIVALALSRESPHRATRMIVRDSDTAQLDRLAGFALVVTALAILATVDAFGFPLSVFAMTVLLLVGGNLIETAYRALRRDELGARIAFIAGAIMAGLVGHVVVDWLLGPTDTPSVAAVTFLATTGALVGALCRTDFDRGDDPVILLSVGLVLWLLSGVGIDPSGRVILLGLLLTGTLGGAAYLTETASIAGMLTGVLVGFITIVLGGFHWFAVLLAFFALGGLSTKYRYTEKAIRGVAEPDRGARGSGNVLGNSLVALAGVIGYAAAPVQLPSDGTLFTVVFTAAVATALADTLSSEIGSLFDRPRLITSFEIVEPGTNGGVTMQGMLAGLCGAFAIGLLGVVLIPELGLVGGVFVLFGGLVGMTADSVLGATLEGSILGNSGVNLVACGIGAGVAVVGLILFGVVM